MKAPWPWVFFLTVCFSSSFAQPSSTVRVQFQLLDTLGKVSYNRFCRDYSASYQGRDYDLSPCLNGDIHRNSFYDDSTKTYQVRGTVVYNDFVWVLIRGLDSMVIECPTFSGTRGQFILGVLRFEKGYYRCYQAEQDTFHLALARQDYFNQWATQLRYDREHLNNYQYSERYKHFLKLLKYYQFPIEDWSNRPLEHFE